MMGINKERAASCWKAPSFGVRFLILAFEESVYSLPFKKKKKVKSLFNFLISAFAVEKDERLLCMSIVTMFIKFRRVFFSIPCYLLMLGSMAIMIYI